MNVKPFMDEDVKPGKDIKENIVQCGLKTHFVGIKRQAKNISGPKYKCTQCTSTTVFDSLAELNSHFKESHPPVICDICKESFNTPSTLS